MKEIYNILNETLVLIFNVVLKAQEKFIRDLGVNLSITEIHTIDAIGIESEKPMSEIAAELGITLSTLTTSIGNLEKKGFVTRQRSDKDRRVVLVSLTKIAEDVVRKHKVFHDNMVKDIVTNLSTEEEYAFVKALDNLLDYFKNNYIR